MGRSFQVPTSPRWVLRLRRRREPNALVAVRPRRRAPYTPQPACAPTQVELYEGLAAHSQNRWPEGASPSTLGRGQRSARPVSSRPGFYYKTFMWPRRGVAVALRAAHSRRPPASVNSPHRGGPPDRYAFRATRTCDVLVVGAGPAGLRRGQRPRGRERRARHAVAMRQETSSGGSLLADDPRAAPAIEGRPALQVARGDP